MRASVETYDSSQEYFFAEGCFITEVSNSAADPAVSIARARVQPGCTTRWHFLRGTAERYVVLEGQGVVELGGVAPSIVGPGDVVIIPPETHQRITNSGSVDLVFLAICTPPFDQQVYMDAEAHHG